MRFDITYMTFSGGLVLMDIHGRFLDFFDFLNTMVPAKHFVYYEYCMNPNYKIIALETKYIGLFIALIDVMSLL